MYSNNRSGTGNLNRRKFFFFSGASVFGFFALKSFPFRLFTGKNKDNRNEKMVDVKENKLAVKRTKGRGLNG